MANERMFQLLKIKTGDYLLPGNDMKTLWRLTKGESVNIAEDGLTELVTHCWELFKWRFELGHTQAVSTLDIDDWDDWVYQEADDTRAAIIKRSVELCPGE